MIIRADKSCWSLTEDILQDRPRYRFSCERTVLQYRPARGPWGVINVLALVNYFRDVGITNDYIEMQLRKKGL